MFNKSNTHLKINHKHVLEYKYNIYPLIFYYKYPEKVFNEWRIYTINKLITYYHLLQCYHYILSSMVSLHIIATYSLCSILS